MKFKKIATVLGSALMVGSTIGLAAAAAYPAPFVQGGAANVAIVVGTNGAEASDMVAATAIGADLASELAEQAVGGVVTVTGGETYNIEKSSDNLNLGDGFTDLITAALDKNDLDFLEDGIYKDANNDEYDTSHEITLANLNTTLIRDKDYKDYTPALGINLGKGDTILTYTITFDDTLNTTYSSMDTSDLMIAGKEYYVKAAATGEITLLDSSDSTILADGETVTVGDKDVTITFIDSTGVKLSVNGETTDKLGEGDTFKLEDDSYVTITELLTSDRETTTQKVEFSLGSGEIVLKNGVAVKVNDKSIDGLEATVNLAGDTLALVWKAPEDTFLTGASGHTSMEMPVFGNIALTYDGANFASEQEVTELASSEDYITLETEIMGGSLNLPILYRSAYEANFTGLGEDGDLPLTTNVSTGDFNVTLTAADDTMFVVTYINGDEGYTYAYQIESIEENDDEDDVIVTLVGLTGESEITLDGIGDDATPSDLKLTLVANTTTDSVTINIQETGSGTVYGDRIVTAAGMQIMLPTYAASSFVNTTQYTAATACAAATAADIVKVTYNASATNASATAYCDDEFVMTFAEEVEDGDIATGTTFTATIRLSDEDGVDVGSTNVTTAQVQKTDSNVGYVFSDLGTMVETDTSGNTNTFVVTYNGEEVIVDAAVVVGGAVSESDSSDGLGTITVMDNEASKMSGKNLIVVGGNCVNSVAAELLGLTAGESCMADFSAKTGVANGGFLIESFARDGKVAMLVAGYSATDTGKAKTYLIANGVADTTAGKKITGTGVNAADVVIA